MSSCHVGSLSVGWKNDSIWGSLVLLKRVSNPGCCTGSGSLWPVGGQPSRCSISSRASQELDFHQPQWGCRLPRGTSHQRRWDFGHIYLLVLNSQFRLVILSMLGTPGIPGTPGMGSILGPRNHLDEESVRWLSAATLAPWTPWNFTNENCWMWLKGIVNTDK